MTPDPANQEESAPVADQVIRLEDVQKVTESALAYLDLEDLLGHYANELRATDQADEADRITGMLAEAKSHFLMIIPEKVQADPSISTE